MSDTPDNDNVETLTFTSGVYVTRRRFECPLESHGTPHLATEYRVLSPDNKTLSIAVRCAGGLLAAPEERIPVHDASATLVNRDADTRDIGRTGRRQYSPIVNRVSGTVTGSVIRIGHGDVGNVNLGG